MRPGTRAASLAVTAAALAAVLALATGLPAAAEPSSPAASTATPVPTAPAQPKSPATPSATAAPSAPASAPSGSSTPSPAPSAPAPVTEGDDPSLAEMNTLGNHTMGSTVAANEPATSPRAQSRLAAPQAAANYVYGMDVSAYQQNVDWATAKKNGSQFAYVKATEGTTYKNAYFSQQYNGSVNAGMIRGAYHFAAPNRSSGAAQASYFVANGGGWKGDGKTLPPLLDLEYNPYVGTDHTNSCWGLSSSAMVNWIRDFTNTMIAKTGRAPAIYTTSSWWSLCVGNSSAFSANPLFIAHYDRALASGPGTLPASWSKWNIWQYADAGVFPGDQDVINGTVTDLKGLALPSVLASPKGVVDQLQVVPGGVKVRGWAFDPNSSASIRVHIYVDSVGKSIAADQARPDVDSAYAAAPAATGYSTTVAATAGSHRVCVYAINVGAGSDATLTCQTVTMPSSTPIGAVNLLAAGPTSISVKGWALDGDVATAIPVDIYIDGRGKRILASGARSDVASAYPAWGAGHGFSATYAATQGSHNVCVYGITKGASGSNKLLGCKTVTVKNRAPIGRLDAVTPHKGSVSFAGWAIDVDSQAKVVSVTIIVDNKGYTQNASVTRTDVGRAYPGAGSAHGFYGSATVKAGTHRVCAYGHDTSGGPVPELGCKVVTTT